MTHQAPTKAAAGGGGKSPSVARAERLKAALKANIARRKAQSRARASDEGAGDAVVDVAPESREQGSETDE